MVNITEILKQVPKGTKLWSNIFGDVEFISIGFNDEYPIRCSDVFRKEQVFTEHGYYFITYEEHSECVLWPSKDHRAWDEEALRILGIEKKPETPFNLQPFDKVLVRDSFYEEWRADFFSHMVEDYCKFVCFRWGQKYCIPYNEETKHLLGTIQEPPEKYRQ